MLIGSISTKNVIDGVNYCRDVLPPLIEYRYLSTNLCYFFDYPYLTGIILIWLMKSIGFCSPVISMTNAFWDSLPSRSNIYFLMALNKVWLTRIDKPLGSGSIGCFDQITGSPDGNEQKFGERPLEPDGQSRY